MLVGVPGCIFRPAAPGGAPAISITKEDGDGLTTPKLQSLVLDFADRYMAMVSAASDDLQRADASPDMRRRARVLKLNYCSAVYAIASNPNPEVGLLDMVVHVSLIRSNLNDGTSWKSLGENVKILRAAFDHLHAEVWGLAKQALSDEQAMDLAQMIEEWRISNPQYKYTAYVRFSDFAGLRYRSRLHDVNKGLINLGRLDPLAPIDDATREIQRSRFLAERALFLAQRLPTLMRWQGEVLGDELLTTPEMKQSLESFKSMSQATTRASAAVENIPALLESREKALRELVAESRKAFAEGAALMDGVQKSSASLEKLTQEARETTVQVNTAIKSTDALLERFSATTKPTRFAIEKYSDAFTKAEGAATALDKLATTVGKLTERPDFKQNMEGLSAETDEKIDRASLRGRELIDLLTVRVIQGTVAMSVMVIVVALVVRRINRKGAVPATTFQITGAETGRRAKGERTRA